MLVGIGRRSRVGMYWGIALKIIHQSYHVLVMLVVARILGPSSFGVMALAGSFMLIGEQLSHFGFPKAREFRVTR